MLLLPAVIPSGAVTHGYLAGDVNDDGALSMKDVLALRRLLAGSADEGDVFTLAADVDGDGTLTMKDVLKLRRIIAGAEDAEGNNTDAAYKVDGIRIADRNIARYAIVYPRVAPEGAFHPSMEHAVRDLRDYIEAACGVTLNIAYEDSFDGAAAIRYVYDEADEYGLGKEGFVFECEDGEFTITCGTQRASLYATYTFLEDFVGYRFLPADIEYLYGADVINIPEGYFDRQVPGFVYRGSTQAGTTHKNFYKMKINALDGGGQANEWNGGGLGTLYIHAHSFAYQMLGFDQAYTAYANDFTNPYHTSQPCMTADDTYEKIIDFNYRLIEEREGWGQHLGYYYTQISCASNDNTNYCNCEKCKAVYEAEGSVSGAMMRLANRVAEKMTEDYPDLDIYTIAYAGGNVPPRMTRPDEDVCVHFCTTGCNNHLLRSTEECDEAGGNPRMRGPIYYKGPVENYGNSKDMAYMSDWLELTDNIYFWYYGANYNYFVSPAANLFNFYDDAKYLAERGMIGFYSEGSSEPAHYNFEYLRTYLASKVLWDPYMTEEEFERHMDEFLEIYYGAGWRDVKSYIFMSNRASDEAGCWTNNHDAPWDVYSEEYFLEHYDEMASLFDSAYEAAKTDETRRHVEEASVHAHFLGLSATYDRDFVNGDAAAKAAYRARYEWLWNYYKDNGYDGDYNPDGIRGTVFGSGTANFNAFPKNASNVVCPMDWIFEDGFDGHAGVWTFPFGLPN